MVTAPGEKGEELNFHGQVSCGRQGTRQPLQGWQEDPRDPVSPITPISQMEKLRL